MEIISVIAIIVSLITRLLYLYIIIHVTKANNYYSFIFTGLSICSSILWIYYSSITDNLPLLIKSIIDLIIFIIAFIFIAYFIKEKINKSKEQISPIT